MRRSAETKLHPAQRVALGEILSEHLPADAPGVLRVQEDDSIWDGLPNVPAVSINCYRLNFNFGDGFDVDTADVWRETVVAAGAGDQVLTLRQWDATGGHATIVAGDGAADLYQYQKQIAALNLLLAEEKRIWFQTQFSYDPANTDQVVFIGFADSTATGLAFDDWGNWGFGFWYNTTEGEWYFSWRGLAMAISASWLTGTDWGPLVETEAYGHVALGQLAAGMNSIDFNLTWEDMGIVIFGIPWGPVPALRWSINGGAISDKLLMPSMRGVGPLFLTFGVGNSGSGLNPALRLNYLHYMSEK